MKKSDEQERNIANRLYNLDKKVYETTGSTLGRVFPSSPSFALEKIIDALKINREYFLKNEMTLIANMIGTIRDEEKAAPLKQEYDELEKDILAYNPTIILPHSIDNNDAVASRRFSSDNHLIICISRQFGTGGHTIGFELAQRLGIAYYDKEIIHLACDRMGLNSKDVTDYGIDSSGSSRGILSSIGKASKKFFSTQSDMLFFTQSNLICEMATQESCIFMGRCADVVLTNNNIPHLSIFLSAPFKERVKYEMGIASCDYKTASAKVKTMDQERKNYYQYYTGRQWGYAGNYDLCVNTFFYGHDETIQVLYDMAEMSCKKQFIYCQFYILDFIRRFFASYTKAYTNIYRKLRRADCRNDFFKHALEYLKGREILFVISLPYFYCAGLAICATLPFLEV